MLSRAGRFAADAGTDQPAPRSGVDAAASVDPEAIFQAHAPSQPSLSMTKVVTPGVSVWTRMLDLWRSRELLVYLVRKELTIKYKNSALGFVWSMLNPALMLLIYWFVFSVLLKNGIPNFAIFLMCGLLVWNLFSTAVTTATTTVVANAGIVKKVAFPREILAIAAVGASLVFFFLQALVLVAVVLIFRVLPPTPSYLPMLIPAVVALLVFTSALSVFLSATNVYFRDIQHLVEVLLVAWFWLTPIVYGYQVVGITLHRHGWPAWLPLLNPITPIVLTFQQAVYGRADVLAPGSGIPSRTGAPGPQVTHLVHILPVHGQLWYLGVLGLEIGISFLLFAGALHVFGRIEGNFAEEL